MASKKRIDGIEFHALTRQRLEEMAEAGERILECYRILRKSDANVVGEVLRGQGEFFEWDHYPKGDIYDHETHAQYYYHAHPPEDRSRKFGTEHGHFHTFLRPKGFPPGIQPAEVPEPVEPDAENDGLSHLIGISMNRAGYPVRLFTTNRWVTGETWYHAADVETMLDRFVMDLALPSWPVNIWITETVRLFRPQIELLLRERDRVVSAWAAKTPDTNAYEDRELELPSLVGISVEKQIDAVAAAL